MFQPRCYQTRLTNKALEELRNVHSVLLESPTGSGKTVMGLMIAQELARQGLKRVAWCSHRREILNQVLNEVKLLGFDVDVTPVSIFSKNVDEFDVMISDECHHDCTESTVGIYTSMKPKKLIGLTATPERTDRFGIIFDKHFTDFGINELIKLDYLSRYNQFMMKEYTPESVAKTYLERSKEFGKTVIFFNSSEECEETFRLLDKSNVRVSTVFHNSNRDEIIPRFAEGDLDVLISIRILTEGYNDPTINTVFVRPSGKHCTVQMAGRLFRKNGDAVKNLVQSQNTRYDFIKHAQPNSSFVQRKKGWVELQGKDLEKLIQKSIKKLISVDVKTLPTPKKYTFS